MNTQLILNYLTELSMNNNREWYHANKDAFKQNKSGRTKRRTKTKGSAARQKEHAIAAAAEKQREKRRMQR